MHRQFLVLILSLCSILSVSATELIEEELEYVPYKGELVEETQVEYKRQLIIPSASEAAGTVSAIGGYSPDEWARHSEALIEQAFRLETGGNVLIIVGSVPITLGAIVGIGGMIGSEDGGGKLGFLLVGSYVASFGIPFTTIGGIMKLKSKRLLRDARYRVSLCPQFDFKENHFGGALSIDF